MAASSNPTDLANDIYRQVFTEGPYTGFIMLDYLRGQANVATWSDILRTKVTNNGFEAFDNATTRKEAIMQDPGLSKLWAQPGRCTSFAIKVISLLEQNSPGTFKFNIYDLGGHRLARCEKTGIIIDSSAIHGAFELAEGKWVKIEGSEARAWKWVKGKSKFEGSMNNRMQIRESRTIISKREALVTCLFEIPGATSTPTLFRSFDTATNTSLYHAVIRWVWKKKSLEVAASLKSREKLVIKFGGGTDATTRESADLVALFIHDFGGTLAEKQWESVEGINARIWNAAIEVWGKPQWKHVTG